MLFSIRPDRRFPVQCFLEYDAGPFMGVRTVWNLSISGWRLPGDLPLRVDEPCSLTVSLPNAHNIFVAVAVECRGDRMNMESRRGAFLGTIHTRDQHYVTRLVKDFASMSHC